MRDSARDFAIFWEQIKEPQSHPESRQGAEALWSLWVFPKIEVPQNAWFIMENPIKMDDLGVPLFSETSLWSTGNRIICFSEVTDLSQMI